MDKKDRSDNMPELNQGQQSQLSESEVAQAMWEKEKVIIMMSRKIRELMTELEKLKKEMAAGDKQE